MVEVYLPRSLLQLFPLAERRPSLEAANVAQVIDRLEERWPGMRARLCDAGPSIREHMSSWTANAPASTHHWVRAPWST